MEDQIWEQHIRIGYDQKKEKYLIDGEPVANFVSLVAKLLERSFVLHGGFCSATGSPRTRFQLDFDTPPNGRYISGLDSEGSVLKDIVEIENYARSLNNLLSFRVRKVADFLRSSGYAQDVLSQLRETPI